MAPPFLLLLNILTSGFICVQAGTKRLPFNAKRPCSLTGEFCNAICEDRTHAPAAKRATLFDHFVCMSQAATRARLRPSILVDRPLSFVAA